MAVTLALVALLAELVLGYPERLFRRIGHPVTWIGRLIAALEARWNRADDDPRRRRRLGHLLVVILLALAAAIGMAAALIPWPEAIGLLCLGVVASTLLAQRSLHSHVLAVAEALEGEGIDAARRSVSRIVGRDVSTLDESAIARAAIESLAENFSDGIVAPVGWLAVAGLGGALAYKAINTADSMIGHRSERYRDFGRAAARLDDLLNLAPSRLSAGLLIAAAALMPGARAMEAARVVARDARQHRSPNAGWPEAAMAGALAIRLSGPRLYEGILSGDPPINGEGRAILSAQDIRRALTLFRVADGLLIGLVALLAVMIRTAGA